MEQSVTLSTGNKISFSTVAVDHKYSSIGLSQDFVARYPEQIKRIYRKAGDKRKSVLAMLLEVSQSYFESTNQHLPSETLLAYGLALNAFAKRSDSRFNRNSASSFASF
ncbi:MAG: hypothetical protein R3A13_07120 [Bdellovibrionota bacterium]